MQYRSTWDLSTIPDEALYAEAGRRRGLLGGRPIKEDPKTEEARRKQREYRRQRRLEGKDLRTKQ